MRTGSSPALHLVLILGFVLAVPAGAAAQPVSDTVPRVIRFNGTISGAVGQTSITIRLYRGQTDEAPIWSEEQVVEADATGRYSVLLGSGSPEGLPLDLFVSAGARWLGVQAAGDAEQARILLVAVPYAMKAADADTIGGKPLSAFVLAGDTTGVGADGLTYVDTRVLRRSLGAAARIPQGGAGEPGYLGMFTGPTELANSVIYQSGTSIGIGTTTPAAAFHSVATSAPGAVYDVYSNSLGALPVVFRAARGTPAGPSAVQSNDILGGLAVRAYGATAFSTGRGQVMFKAAENWTDTAQGTYLQFTTTPTGTSTWVERMRIDPAGNIGIGTDHAQPAPDGGRDDREHDRRIQVPGRDDAADGHHGQPDRHSPGPGRCTEGARGTVHSPGRRPLDQGIGGSGATRDAASRSIRRGTSWSPATSPAALTSAAAH